MTDPANLSPNQRAWRRFWRNRGAAAALMVLLALIALVLLWPLGRTAVMAGVLPKAMTHPPDSISDAQFAPPSRNCWFGTDEHGRDLLSRVCHGALISLAVGLVGAAVSLVIGVLWGAVAGYAGGRWDSAMMRFVDVLYAMPTVVFVIVLITALNAVLAKWQTGPHAISDQNARFLQLAGLFAGLGAVSWLTMARIVRGQVLSLRRRPFIDASLALGASHARIIWRHILPNVYGIIIVYLTLMIPSIILYESFLSYLGLGIQPPQASLGSLIASGAGEINPIRIYWWLIVFPGAALALTLLALTFVGDGLRDAFDPRDQSGQAV
ncbi:MAG TPA: ABC transporter permease [Verrucomicrobiae bacterium]|jgi:peptide/nickel transport system permease protein/oligopeptide transport system permease protein